MNKEVLTKEELLERNELCNYCFMSDYGNRKINDCPENMCEGLRCDDTYLDYLDILNND